MSRCFLVEISEAPVSEPMRRNPNLGVELRQDEWGSGTGGGAVSVSARSDVRLTGKAGSHFLTPSPWLTCRWRGSRSSRWRVLRSANVGSSRPLFSLWELAFSSASNDSWGSVVGETFGARGFACRNRVSLFPSDSRTQATASHAVRVHSALCKTNRASRPITFLSTGSR